MYWKATREEFAFTNAGSVWPTKKKGEAEVRFAFFGLRQKSIQGFNRGLAFCNRATRCFPAPGAAYFDSLIISVAVAPLPYT